MKTISITLIFLISISFTVPAPGQSAVQPPIPQVQYKKPDNGVLRIISFNIRNGIGMDNKTDYDRIAAIINKISPDVVALQELDSVTSRSKGVDVLKILAGKCGMKATYGASIPFQGGKYGIGILSKEAPVKTSFTPLPGREERRGLLMAEFNHFILFCTHFSLTEADRRESVGIINQIASRLNKITFLSGDLNASPESEAIRSISEQWQNLSGILPTFPSTSPTTCIDYIWGYHRSGSKFRVTETMVVSEPMASDHRPVFIDVKLKKMVH